jgi:23S rRNA (pseudouridine1915-N3)-methyltransferase
MKITLLAIGRLGKDPEALLVQEYAKRLQAEFTLVELQKQASKDLEGKRLLEKVPEKSLIIALDERGKSYTSVALAQQLQHWVQHQGDHLTFILGGADGLSQELKTKAYALLSLGPLTLPHGLARVILVEQLYRAQQISNYHPYHKD